VALDYLFGVDEVAVLGGELAVLGVGRAGHRHWNKIKIKTTHAPATTQRRPLLPQFVILLVPNGVDF